MRSLIFTILTVTIIASCTSKKKVDLPPPPTSVDAVVKTITGKKYSTTELALVSTSIADKNNPYEWFDEVQDTTPYFKNLRAQKMKTAIHFINDTTVEIADEAGTNTGTWNVDDQPKSTETAGIFTRITIIRKNEPLLPGQTEPSKITFNYKVLGIDDKLVFLETPNMFSMRKVAALMKAD
jgi:hypothetical protein